MILENELSLSLFAFLSHKIAADKKKQKNNDYTPCGVLIFCEKSMFFSFQSPKIAKKIAQNSPRIENLLEKL